MMSDSFIESVITPKNEGDDDVIYREFYGMESVAQFEEDDDKSEEGGDDE